MLAAAGAAMFTPTASGVATALAGPERRGRALALVMGGMSVSSAARRAARDLARAAYGWRATIWLVAGLAVLGFAGVAALVPDVGSPRPAGWGAVRAAGRPGRARGAGDAADDVRLGAFTAYTYIGSLFDLPLAAVLWAWGRARSWATSSAAGSPTRTGRAGWCWSGLAASTRAHGAHPGREPGPARRPGVGFHLGCAGLAGRARAAVQARRGAARERADRARAAVVAQYAGLVLAGIMGGLALDGYGRAGVIALAAALGAGGGAVHPGDLPARGPARFSEVEILHRGWILCHLVELSVSPGRGSSPASPRG